MSLIEDMKNQTCVHWARTGLDGYGHPTYATPVERLCRWVDTNELYLDSQGQQKSSAAVVYVDGVAVGDVLMLGSLADSGFITGDPLRNSKAWAVKRYDSKPNLDGDEFLRKAFL